MGPEDQGPGPLRLCTQICTSGTVYPLPLGSEFIRDLRIMALDLSVFVRKSALQVHCSQAPLGQSSYETRGSRPWTSPSLYANLHFRYSVPTPPWVRVHTGPENHGPGPLRLCTQICTAGTLFPGTLGSEHLGPEDQGPGTVYPLPLGSEFIWDLRIKALDLSVFVRKSHFRYTVSAPPGGRVHM
jgi:hypothetical protein